MLQTAAPPLQTSGTPLNNRIRHQVTGEPGTLFAAAARISGRFRLDHLERGVGSTWISGGPCAQRVQKAVEALSKNNPGFLSASASDAFRGLFWYPPGGFDSWHTDSTLLKGWRLYLVDVAEPSDSFFAYQVTLQLCLRLLAPRPRRVAFVCVFFGGGFWVCP